MPVLPTIRGLYLCELVVTDLVTKNLTLHNCFRVLKVAFLPAKARPFFVVAYLANGLGDFTFVVRVKRLDILDEIYSALAMLSFSSRLEELRLRLRIEQCNFPGPGEYEVSLCVGDEILAQTPFKVRPLENLQ